MGVPHRDGMTKLGGDSGGGGRHKVNMRVLGEQAQGPL